MGLNRGVFVLVVLVLVAAAAELVGKADAATYVVGDSLGWSVPSTANEYSTWASRHVFRSGDVLVFNFMSGQHDVAEVTKSAFDGCSSTNPIKLSTVGPWNTTLNATGENFFICTFGAHCSLGQKLAINVTASPATPPTSSPPTPTPMPMPGSPPPASSPTPMPPTPMPGSPSPTPMPGSPSPTPMPGSPSPTPMPGSPGSSPPAGSPLPGTPGGAPTTPTPGAESPPSPPGNSATLSTISATLVVFASLAFGLAM